MNPVEGTLLMLYNWIWFIWRDDLEADEYEETKNDTLEQLKDFNESLSRMKEGNLSLVDEVNRMQLVRGCPYKK